MFLSSNLNETIQAFGSQISQQVTDKVCNSPVCISAALDHARLTRDQFELLNEAASGIYEDPRLTNYYTTLSRIIVAVLAQTLEQVSFVRE